MKLKILFLCTGNSCRSQMAEAYGKQFLSGKFDFYSAAIEKHGLNPKTIKILNENGIDTSNLYSKTVNELKNINFNFVITMCDNAKETCPIYYFNKSNLFHKGFKDHAKATGSEEEILEEFRKVRDEIKNFIKNDLENMLKNSRRNK